MNDPAGALLSVRGDARRLVAPDYVVPDAAITLFTAIQAKFVT